MMSIFSFLSSETTALTRLPRGPTHAPTGSTPASLDHTATFERRPASRATASLPDLQQIHLEALAVLVALVWHLLARGQYGLDPSKIDQRHPPVGLLYDTGHDVTHALAVLVQQLLVVYLVQALVESLAHYLGGYAREVVRGYVLAVLHDPEVARILVENDPCVFVGPLATLVSGEKRLLQHALHRCERDALVRLYLVQR